LSYFYRCGLAKRAIIDSYHSQWAQNLCKDKDSRVFVAERKNSIKGFIVLSVDSLKKDAKIVLIAVKKSARGLGIGKALVQKSLEWSISNIKRIDVRTQKDNKKAIFLYKGTGFKIISRDKIFYKRIA